jgi:hypothetical protein
METKIKDITGAEITVTDLKEAVRQCRECLASPYLMPSGHTVGENHAYMLRQLLALQRRKREHGRQRPPSGDRRSDSDRKTGGFLTPQEKADAS